VFGYLVLHPVSMVIFRVLSPGTFSHGRAGHSILLPILHSFELEMLPMAVVFSLFSGAIAAGNGYQRARLAMQRSELAARADLLRARNERLADLERTNRRTARFMVHDFKTHLGAILGFADLLLERKGTGNDAGLQDALVRIRRQSPKMLGAVRELLDFSRLKELSELSRSSVSVAGLLADACDQHLGPGGNGEVHVGESCRSCPPVLADAGIVRRVLANLVSNALRHNAEPVRVELDAKPHPGESAVTFSCRDDGRGVAADLADHVFEEFSGTAGAGSDSTGLGLAFCREAVEAHGGRIWLERPGGPGATFCFTLPCTEEDHDDCRVDSREAGARR
jgi:signal transduction histidine kinase